MYLTASTATINLSTGVISQSIPIAARSSLALTLAGIGTVSAANARAALYRLNRNGIDGTLVATCNTFVVSGANLIGTMNLNTTELVAAYTALVSLRQYEQLRFEILVWDASTNVYTVWDHLEVGYEFPLADNTSNVSPISTSTTTWGNLRIAGGVVYLYNVTTGLWNKLEAAGVDNQQHMELGDGANI